MTKTKPATKALLPGTVLLWKNESHSSTKALLPGTVLLWKNEDFHWKLLFQSKEQVAVAEVGAEATATAGASWADWYRKKGIPCDAISLQSGKILLLEPPVEEGEITLLLHILIDGKVGWIVLNRWSMKQLEVLG